MTDSVSISAVSEAAAAFNWPLGDEHLNCGEAVIAALWDAFQPDFPRAFAVSVGAGMGRGFGGSGCVCGSLNGGIAFIGMMLGDKNLARPLVRELHDAFRDGTGKHVTCCRVLTRGLEWGTIERRTQCKSLCSLAAAETARILCRELGITAEA